MNKNPIKEKMRAGDAVVGTFCNLPSPGAAEMLGIAGFDFIIIDAEHSPVDLDTCEHMVRACDVSGMAAMVRVALNLPQNLLRYLDTGVCGVQIPMVGTKEEAEMVVAATKYPPIGRRGLAAHRATRYGTNIDLAEYVRTANEETLVCVQVETVDALSKVEEIASVDLVDLVFLGPTDLSSAMGLPGQPTHPSVLAAIEDAGRTIMSAGKAAGTIAGSPEAYAHWRSRGFQYLCTGLTNLIAGASQDYISGAREYERRRASGGGSSNLTP